MTDKNALTVAVGIACMAGGVALVPHNAPWWVFVIASVSAGSIGAYARHKRS